MIELKDYIAAVGVAIAGAVAWFGLKSDVRSLTERTGQVEMGKALVVEHGQRIRDLEMYQAQNDEQRRHTAKLIEKIEAGMGRQDNKLDSLLTAITQVDTRLNERTKESHS